MRTSSKNSRFKEAIPEEEIAMIMHVIEFLKTEKLYLVRPKTIEQAYQVMEEYIYFYNHSRFQEKLYDLSSIEY
jgi:putative transposase